MNNPMAAIGGIVVAALIIAVTSGSGLAFVLTVIIGTMLYAIATFAKPGKGHIKPQYLAWILLLPLAAGAYILIHHSSAPVAPKPPASMSITKAEPWRHIKPLEARSPTNPLPEVTITGCTVEHGTPVVTPTTATKTVATETAATISGSVTNIDKTPQNFMLRLSVTAGSFSSGAGTVQVTSVAPGQTVLWSTPATINFHPTETPTCRVLAAQAETTH